MSRVPLDRTPQAQLVLDLRIAIDRARKHNNERAYARFVRILADNPRSAWRSHVQYNIGPSRARWMADHAPEGFALSDAHALAGANAISLQRTFAASAELSQPDD